MWPAVSYESHSWSPSGDGTSRRSRQRHTGPYEAAVVPRIAEESLGLPSAVAGEVEEAATALARVDATLSASGFHALPAVLMRTESTSSSQIERLTASARSLAIAELGEATGDNALSVVAHVRAMQTALGWSRAVDTGALVDIHDVLIKPDPVHASGIRKEQVWIGGEGTGPHRADFVPPHHSRIPDAMADLDTFIARADMPIIAQVAIAHAQFETIHPFTDGNGRTGRTLIHMMLRDAGLTRGSTIPISAGLLHETDAYIAALMDYRRGDVIPIVEQVARAAIFASALTEDLSDRVQLLESEWRGRLHARRGAAVWRLLELLPARPAVNYELVMTELGVTSRTAYDAIAALEDAGILTSTSGHRRNRVWVAPEVLEALDEFAERARRR